MSWCNGMDVTGEENTGEVVEIWGRSVHIIDSNLSSKREAISAVKKYKGFDRMGGSRHKYVVWDSDDMNKTIKWI